MYAALRPLYPAEPVLAGRCGALTWWGSCVREPQDKAIEAVGGGVWTSRS
jgi:hypothetical protein